MMKVFLMCFRPRSQRIGEGSQDRHIKILDWDYYAGEWRVSAESAVRAMVAIQLAQLDEREIFNFQTEPNDEFYVKIERGNQA